MTLKQALNKDSEIKELLVLLKTIMQEKNGPLTPLMASYQSKFVRNR